MSDVYEILVYRDRHRKWCARISVGQHKWRLITGASDLQGIFQAVRSMIGWLK